MVHRVLYVFKLDRGAHGFRGGSLLSLQPATSFEKAFKIN